MSRISRETAWIWAFSTRRPSEVRTSPVVEDSTPTRTGTLRRARSSAASATVGRGRRSHSRHWAPPGLICTWGKRRTWMVLIP